MPYSDTLASTKTTTVNWEGMKTERKHQCVFTSQWNTDTGVYERLPVSYCSMLSFAAWIMLTFQFNFRAVAMALVDDQAMVNYTGDGSKCQENVINSWGFWNLPIPSLYPQISALTAVWLEKMIPTLLYEDKSQDLPHPKDVWHTLTCPRVAAPLGSAALKLPACAWDHQDLALEDYSM